MIDIIEEIHVKLINSFAHQNLKLLASSMFIFGIMKQIFLFALIVYICWVIHESWQQNIMWLAYDQTKEKILLLIWLLTDQMKQ